MLQSIIVYTITAMVLFWLAYNVSCRERYLLQHGKRCISFFCPEIVLILFVFALVAGLRYKVGVDHLSYLRDYDQMKIYGQSSRPDIEPLFHCVGKVFARLDLHYVFYFAFWAAIQIGLIIYSLLKNKDILPYVMIYLMLGPYFISFMNGIRQAIAECIFLFSIQFVERRDWCKYLITIIVATLIHKSVVLVAPLYFFPYTIHLLEKRMITLSLLLLCTVVGSTSSLAHWLVNASSLLEFIGYSGYVDSIDYFTSQDHISAMAWGPSRLSMFIVGASIILFYPKMKRYYENNNLMQISFAFMFMGECLFNLLANTSYLFLRPVAYLTIFRLVMFGYLVNYLWKNKRTCLAFFLIVISMVFMYWNIYKATGLKNEHTLYKFFFEFS